MASIKELLTAMIAKINGKNEGVDWNENNETSPAFVKNRPFYDKSLVSVPHPQDTGLAWYKVSDDVPTGHPAAGDKISFMKNGNYGEGVIILSTDDGYVSSEAMVVVALKDNYVISELDNLTFPEKGTYFLAGEGLTSYTGFALGIHADPEITWDGSTGEIKQLDEKFIPPVSSLIVKSSKPNSTKKFKITVDDTGAISTTEVTE